MTKLEENAIKITHFCEKEGMTIKDLCDACWIILGSRMIQLKEKTQKLSSHQNP